MELTTLHNFDNGYMGYGFMELGADHKRDPVRPYSLNFDVIAHEMGHALIYSLLGLPDGDDRRASIWAFTKAPPIWWR